MDQVNCHPRRWECPAHGKWDMETSLAGSLLAQIRVVDDKLISMVCCPAGPDSRISLSLRKRSWQHFKMKFFWRYGRELCNTLESIRTLHAQNDRKKTAWIFIVRFFPWKWAEVQDRFKLMKRHILVTCFVFVIAVEIYVVLGRKKITKRENQPGRSSTRPNWTCFEFLPSEPASHSAP